MPSSYAIGSHLESLIKQKIESGRYNSASEVVRYGVTATRQGRATGASNEVHYRHGLQLMNISQLAHRFPAA